jgi:hypothetical protein
VEESVSGGWCGVWRQGLAKASDIKKLYSGLMHGLRPK